MPKELTHWILAERTLKALEKGSRLHELISLNKNAYLGGAVLPDTLLHLFTGPYAKTALASAHHFHDTCDNSYIPLIIAESRFPDGFPGDMLACMLGVISHMAVDSVFHPFVYSQSGTNDIGRHYRLETDIDVYFINKGYISPVKRLADIVTPESRETLLAVTRLLFAPDNELPHEALERALKLHCRFQAMYGNRFWQIAAIILSKLLGSPYSEQRHLFYPISAYGAAKTAYLDALTEWKHPVDGMMNTGSVDDLADRAVCCSVELFRRIGETGKLAATLSNQPGANLLTGMNGVAMRKMKV